MGWFKKKGTGQDITTVVGNREYTNNFLVEDGEVITSSIDKIDTFLNDEFKTEYFYFDGFQSFAKQVGVLNYFITQDENSNIPFEITDFANVLNDLNLISISTDVGKPIYKVGSILPLESNIVKVVSYNQLTGEIILNFEPKTDFRISFKAKYSRKDVPNGKISLGSINQVIINNEASNNANEISYDNSISGLSSLEVQSSIDELANLTKYNSFGVLKQPTIVDNLDGSVTIGTDGIVIFNKENDGSGLNVKLNCTTGATITIPNNTFVYLVAQYNNGNPIYSTVTSSASFLVNMLNIPVVKLSREGNKIHSNEMDEFGKAGNEKHIYKDIILRGIERQSGLALSTSVTRISKVFAGTIWYGTQLWHTVDNIAGASGSLFEYYLNGGTWIKSASQNSYDSTYYSDGTNRQSLGVSKWVSKYFFRDCGDDNEVYYIHGNQYNSSADALNESLPSMPSIITSHSIYVGKIVIQQGATNGIAYSRDWGTSIQNASVTDHENLSGLLGGLAGDHQHLTVTELNYVTNIPILREITKETTGFADPDNVIVSYNSTNRIITLTGNVSAYWRGVNVPSLVSGWTSTAHANLNGTYYLYYNGTDFIWSTSVWTFDMLQIAYINFQTNDKFAVRETHGLMAWQTHRELHQTLGTYKVSGADLTNYTLASATPANRRPYISNTTIADEDLITTNALHISQLYTKSFLTSTGNGITNFTVETADIVPLNVNQPYYNQNNGGTWQQTLMSNNNYQAIWLIAIPTSSDVDSQKYRYVWIQGQSQSATLTTIQALTPSDLTLGTLPTISNEFVFLAKVIIRYTAGAWQITSVTNLSGNRYNQTSVNSGGFLTAVNVGSGLTGDGTPTTPITNNLITGVSGGQTIFGGTLTTNRISIRGNTSDLTTGGVSILDTTVSASKTTGALTVAGGVGIEGTLNVNTIISSSNISTNGSVIGVAGIFTNVVRAGGGAGTRLNMRGNGTDLLGGINFLDTTQSTSSITGSITCAGGIGIAKDLFTGGNKIQLSSNYDGSNSIYCKNTSSGVSASGQFIAENDNNVTIGMSSFSSTRGFIMGKSASNSVGVLTDSTNVSSMIIGTLVNKPLIIGTNNVERARVTETGALLVGTDVNIASGATSVPSKFTIVQGSNNAVANIRAYTSSSPNGAVLSIGRSKSDTIGTETVTSSGDLLGLISFDGVNSNSAPKSGASIEVYQSGVASTGFLKSDMVFTTGDGTTLNEVGRFTNAGVLSLPKGQIKFPAIQNASDDVNTLDAYNEMDWTTTLTCGTSGTITLDATYRTGFYTKVGRLVHINGYLAISSVSSPIGELRLNLPITSSSTYGNRSAIVVYCKDIVSNAIVSFRGTITQGATYMVISKLIAYDAGTGSEASNELKANTEIWFQGTYTV